MSETTAADQAETERERPHILVVDDDKDLADTYALWLSEGCDVETVYSGVEANERLTDDLDVVLLDRRMPGMPGDEVLREIRERELDCRVAMLTAVEPDTDIIDLPFDEYLTKPVTQSELRETVDELLLRQGFDEEVREYLSMEAKTEVLATREESNLRDPEAAADLAERTEEVAQEDRIAELESELDRLRRLSSVVRDVDRRLVLATSREEIERELTERLAETDPYEAVWVGEYTRGFEQATPNVAAGADADAVDTEATVDAADGPIETAVETGDVQVVTERSAVEALLAPFDTAPDVAGAAVVPVAYRDTVYGVIVLYAGDADLFDDREVSVLSDLGDTVANAINSVESRNLMLADTVVELEFEVSDRGDVFVDLSAETGTTIELKGFVPTSSGGLTTYLEVTGATAETFLDAATQSAAIESVRALDESSDGHLYECRVDGDSVVGTLVVAGGKVESMRVEDGRGHLTATIAPETDVRTLVETVRDTFEDVDLVAKRRTDRDLQSTEDFRKSLENRLTDRQYTVLEAAYAAGYFDWPRNSTAKEVAQSLDLAPPTLHEHLRGAERELIETFFEETGKFESPGRGDGDGDD